MEAKLNIVQCQKIDILVLCSLNSTSTGLSLKNFEKGAHPSIKLQWDTFKRFPVQFYIKESQFLLINNVAIL